MHIENVTICLEYGFDILPKAEKLNGGDSQKFRRPVNNRKSFALKMSEQFLSSIEYPNETVVLQNASYLGRVMEPNVKTFDVNIM